eukprot:NODE_2761_length_2149_cov_7.721563.p2 GENE.NODE_2761_length_2149_cov_7.721563~~NODE_2761_length_2149_cov_7.721563.p2  ORF type:complete len:333 (+),score=108.89 NODE_2761_length_2149_cov_7.721563:929-1927(+)
MTQMFFESIMARGLHEEEEEAAVFLDFVGPPFVRWAKPAVGAKMPDGGITCDIFVHAALSAKRLRICDLVKLFDVDRMPRFLESFFAPPEFHTLGARVAALRAERLAGGREEVVQESREQSQVAIGAGSSVPLAAVCTDDVAAPPRLANATCDAAGAERAGHVWAKPESAEHCDASADVGCHASTELPCCAGCAAELRELREVLQASLLPLHHLLAGIRSRIASHDDRLTRIECEMHTSPPAWPVATPPVLAPAASLGLLSPCPADAAASSSGDALEKAAQSHSATGADDSTDRCRAAAVGGDDAAALGARSARVTAIKSASGGGSAVSQVP